MSALQTERLQSDLHRLTLSQLPSTLDRIAEEATAKDLGYLDCLERLLEEATQATHHRPVTLTTQMARFPYVKRLDAFDFGFQPSLEAKRIKELASLRFLEERANVLFLGPPGVGKTPLAIALGLEAITQGSGVVFTTLAGLLSSLERATAQNTLEERLQALGQSRLLILDEVGYVPLDRWGATCLFQIVCQRYERGSVILTRNKSDGDWGTLFPDPIIASAILDRLLPHSTTVVIKGPSYRLKEKRKAGVALPVEPGGRVYRSRPMTLGKIQVMQAGEYSIDVDTLKQTQWRAFVGRLRLDTGKRSLGNVIEGLRAFLMPSVEALTQNRPFQMTWPPGGPWT